MNTTKSNLTKSPRTLKPNTLKSKVLKAKKISKILEETKRAKIVTTVANPFVVVSATKSGWVGTGVARLGRTDRFNEEFGIKTAKTRALRALYRAMHGVKIKENKRMTMGISKKTRTRVQKTK